MPIEPSMQEATNQRRMTIPFSFAQPRARDRHHD
jgi:hypothetical protein